MKTDLAGGRSAAHCRTVIGTDLRASEGVREHVKRDVVGIRPHAYLWIIRELGTTIVKGITVVCPGRVRCRRDGYTLQVRGRRDLELCQDPAIVDLVVLNNYIAVIVSLASASKAGPECIASYRPEDKCPSRLIEYRVRLIDPLHDLRCTHREIRIGRRSIGRKSVIAIANTCEV